MKRIIVMIVAVCFVSCAYADTDNDLFIHYNSWANIIGAPTLDKEAMRKKGDYYYFDSEKMNVVFEIMTPGEIRAGYILMNDDSYAADFLASCITMTAFFSKFDYNYYGAILQQFMELRMNKSTFPYNIGTDVFQIVSSEETKYAFVYMNKDMKLDD